ncbi:uncharacterized protein E0L32_010311 [Thyridium curvatum]|uniref:Uncharacterized protein n=1 Tax=Thyridium curvatum TaxID=1093900 RepID=A0A507AUS1_9PEZI|nr:uncharacterized protein E0L32_010311 [Thyridium curvatum]TPX07980.1 hypothetical protein E0L32_010311 [Thyridium curvatum]
MALLVHAAVHGNLFPLMDGHISGPWDYTSTEGGEKRGEVLASFPESWAPRDRGLPTPKSSPACGGGTGTAQHASFEPASLGVRSSRMALAPCGGPSALSYAPVYPKCREMHLMLLYHESIDLITGEVLIPVS